jgi:hypothetical protein
VTADERVIRDKIRAEVAKLNGTIKPDQIADDTLLLERRIVNSLDIVELVLFIETLRQGRPLERSMMKGSSFASIDAIYRTFLAPRE